MDYFAERKYELTIRERKTIEVINDVLLHFAEESINVDNISKLVYLNDSGTMNNFLSNANGYNLGTGYIADN